MSEQLNDKFWELAASKLHNEAKNEEITELDKLLAEGDNTKAFSRIEEIHNKLPGAESLEGISSLKSWGRIVSYFDRIRNKLYLNIFKYAAILIVAFFSGSLLNPGWTPFSNKPQAFAEINVPLGQMSEVTLYDGTRVWLNSGTTITYSDNFGEDVRKVKLEGEAFFDVKKDRVPFKVQLRNSEIEVLGTSFAALSYKEDNISKVTLVDGSLRINDLFGSYIGDIKPNQQVNIPDNLDKCSVKRVDTKFYESWTEGKIIFDEERLKDIATRLERWYNVDINFAQSEIGELKFSGTILKNKPFNQIMTAFSLLLPLKIDYEVNIEEKDIITISKKI